MSLAGPRPKRASPVGIMMGIGPVITDADDSFLAIVGYTRADFDSGGMDWQVMTPPEHLHLDEAGIRQAMASDGGFTAPYQKEFFRKDGTRVPVLLVCAFVPGAEGRWIGYVVDLSQTEPRHALSGEAATALATRVPEELYGRLVSELVRERARTFAMLENADALIWAVDTEGRLLASNARFQAVQALLSGRPMMVGESVVGSEYPPEMVARWKALYARAMEGERISTRTRLPLADRVIHHESQLAPIVDGQRGAIGVTVVAHDVTERVGVEEALRESEARFRSLATSSPLGIFLADVSGAGVYVNPRMENIWGRPGAELLGYGWLRYVHADDVARVQREWKTAIAAEAEVVIDYRLSLSDVGERHVRVWAAPVRHGEGITGYVGSIEDATARHAVAARERQREKMESLGTLAGGIAHDFNNMLSVILGYVEVALDEPRAHDLDVMLQEIQTAGRRARELVRQILTFSRGGDQADELVELGHLTTEGVRLLRATLPTNITIALTVPKDPVVVRGNPAALQQIVVNLCTNAAHAMRDVGGTITVGLATRGHEDGGDAIVSVVDAGHGMSTAVQARLFEPFFTTKPLGEGTGMGLAVVHGVVTAHGGSLLVESSPGAGARFDVSLPLVSGTPHANIVAPPPVSVGAAHVLFAEDEPSVSRLTARTLERAGYTVTRACDGMEALRVFSANPDRFDLVLSDLAMPGLTGDKLARAIHVVRPHLPFVLTSGFRGALGDASPAELGVDVLDKPYDGARLVEVIQSALARAARKI